MRIAISSETDAGLDAPVAGHFGHSPFFTLIELEGDEVSRVEVAANPYATGHKPGQVPAFVKSQDVETMITGGMGARAAAFFEESGIRPVTGAAGTVRETLGRFLRGELSSWDACSDSVAHGHHDHRH